MINKGGMKMNRYGVKSKEKDTTALNRYNKEIDKYSEVSVKTKEWIVSKLSKVQDKGYFKDYWKKVNKIKDSGGSYLDLYGELKEDMDIAYNKGDKIYKVLEQLESKGKRYIEVELKLSKIKQNKEKLLAKNPNVKQELNKKNEVKERKDKDKVIGINKSKLLKEGNIIGLEEWLNTYKVNLANHFKLRYEKGYIKSYEYREHMNKLDKYVEMQKDILLSRAYNVVGDIKGIEFGSIGIDGSFNGNVVGVKGKASIYTTLAGGMVQRLHYRVYIKKL